MNTSSTNDALVMYGQSFSSRLLLGTARYPSPSVLQAAVQRAQPAMVTASLRRQGSNPAESGHGFWDLLRSLNVRDLAHYLDYVCTEPLHSIRLPLERFAKDHGVHID